MWEHQTFLEKLHFNWLSIVLQSQNPGRSSFNISKQFHVSLLKSDFILNYIMVMAVVVMWLWCDGSSGDVAAMGR